MTTVWQGFLLAGLAIGAAILWRRALPILKQVFSTGSVAACVALGIIGACYAILTSLDRVIVYVVATAFTMLVLAFVLEVKDRLRDDKEKASAAQS